MPWKIVNPGFTLCLVSFTLYLVSFTLCLVSFTLYLVSFTLYLVKSIRAIPFYRTATDILVVA